MGKSIRIRAALFASILLLSAIGAPLSASASGGDSSASALSQRVTAKSMSLNVRDADVRDVLSAIAVNMGYSIIYKGSSQNVTVKLENVTPNAAFDYILKMAGLTYVQEGTTLIVASRSVLMADFARSLSLTRFNLNYLTPEVVSSKISQLSLPVTVLTLGSNEKALWVQGFPTDIAKVGELLTVLDVEENLDVSGADSANQDVRTLSSIRMRELTAAEFNRFLRALGVENGLAISDDEELLWIYATPAERKTILDIRSKVDRSSVNVNESSAFEVLTVRNISKKTAVAAIAAICPNLTVISVDNAAATFFVNGDRFDIERARELLGDLDGSTRAVSTTFFKYSLTHITAAEAQRRLQNVTFGDSVRWYVSTHPEFARAIFIYCGSDYKEQVEELLDEIDNQPIETIHLPVFNGGSQAAAQTIQQYLEDMLPADKIVGTFKIQNYGVNHLLYLEGTNAETVRIVEMLIERFADLPTDEENVDISWETYAASLPTGVEPSMAGYGQWVYNRLHLGSGGSGDSTGDSFSPDSTEATFQSRAQTQTIADIPPAPSPAELLAQAVGVLDTLFYTQGPGSFIAGHLVNAEAVLSVALRTLENEGLSPVAVALDEGGSYTAPTESQTGSLTVPLRLTAGEANVLYEVSLEVPIVPAD